MKKVLAISIATLLLLNGPAAFAGKGKKYKLPESKKSETTALLNKGKTPEEEKVKADKKKKKKEKRAKLIFDGLKSMSM